MDIQWYPGHIAKARNEIKKNLKLVDIVIEIIDSRSPISTKNVLLDENIKNKLQIVIMNKVDLADDKKTIFYKNHLIKNNIKVIAIDSRKNSIDKEVNKIVDEISKDILIKRLNKGIKNSTFNAMVVGMPNVGKSTFINSYMKKAVAKTGNKVGVTKGLQWVKMNNKLALLDTPGVTKPKFDDENIGVNLALIGCINDDIIDKSSIVIKFLDYLKNEYNDLLKKRYDISFEISDSSIMILEKIGMQKNCLKKGGEIDYDKVSNMIIDDFRSGKIGKITLKENI